MKKIIPALVVLFLITLLPSLRTVSVRTSTPRSVLAKGSNQFAFSLMRSVMSDDTSNKVVSPVGVYLSMGLLYNAANKDTRDVLAHTMQVADMDINKLNALSRSLLQELSLADKKARFAMANSIWANRKKLKLSPAFTQLGDEYYYTNVMSVPFAGKATSDKVNKWTTENTDRMFPPILPTANPNDLLYLTNGCCFSCSWQQPFDSANTQIDFFYPATSEGTASHHRIAVPFMKKTQVMKAYSDTSFTMVELPYGDFNAYSLYIVLPDNVQQTARQFMSTLQESRFYDAITRMNDQWVDLSLPRWEQTNDSADISPALKQMGLGILFNQGGSADLSNMCTIPGRSNLLSTWDILRGKDDMDIDKAASTPISKFYHRTCFNVTERGTFTDVSAPASAEAPVSAARNGGRRSLTIKADRPFLYFVVAREQQMVLLTGIMNNPVDVPAIKPHLPSKSPKQGLRLLHGKERRRPLAS